MGMLGTIVNGSVQLDSPSKLPDGTRVLVYEEDDDDLEEYEYPHPMAPYDREKEIALLKERIESDETGIPMEEAFRILQSRLDCQSDTNPE